MGAGKWLRDGQRNGRNPEGRRHSQERRRFRGQTALEFALIAPLYFICVFTAIDAALWSIESEGSISLAEQAARLAVSASGTANSQVAPATSTVLNLVKSHVSQALFATRIVTWPTGLPCPPGVSGGYAGPSEVASRFGPSTIALCVTTSGGPGSPIVRVEVVGYMSDFVPPIANLGWKWGGIPLDVGVVTHAIRYSS